MLSAANCSLGIKGLQVIPRIERRGRHDLIASVTAPIREERASTIRPPPWRCQAREEGARRQSRTPTTRVSRVAPRGSGRDGSLAVAHHAISRPSGGFNARLDLTGSIHRAPRINAALDDLLGRRVPENYHAGRRPTGRERQHGERHGEQSARSVRLRRGGFPGAVVRVLPRSLMPPALAHCQPAQSHRPSFVEVRGLTQAHS